MKKRMLVGAIVVTIYALLVVSPAPFNGTEAKSKGDTFSAMAYLPSGAGMMGAKKF